MSGIENLIRWRNTQHNKAMVAYNEHPKMCKHCGKEIPYEKRTNDYCNSSCFASESNKGVCRNKNYYDQLRLKTKTTKHIPKKKRVRISPIALPCKLCGKENPSSRNAKGFCGVSHFTLYKTKQLIESGSATHANKRAIRSYLIYINNGKCEQCKHGSWLGHKLSLEIHHIDGNVDNMQLSNLVLLCPNCHSITDNYKSKNKNTNTNRNMYGVKKGECQSGQMGET